MRLFLTCVYFLHAFICYMRLFLTLVGRRTSSADMLSQWDTCSEKIEISQQIIIFNQLEIYLKDICFHYNDILEILKTS